MEGHEGDLGGEGLHRRINDEDDFDEEGLADEDIS
jgi:hypothetical protein